jgi:serine/threonine protein kinase
MGEPSTSSDLFSSSGTTTPPPLESGVVGREPPASGVARELMRDALKPGAVVGGKFVLIREIGRGSTGVVFEVSHEALGHRVAIKALHHHIAQNPNIMWRFKREAQLTASLKHPNIISVFDVGQQQDSVYFIVQELLDGTNLRHLLQQRRLLPPAEALDYLVPIMGALVAAHHKGIVHRDVKPENIFLARTAEGVIVPKLIDFGLAKMESEKGEFETQLGVVMGTPSYMSPEQAKGLKADARTDVWSLGVTLFEALSGERPFQSDRAFTALERIRTGPPRQLATVAPHLPAELADIVHRALEPDLARRYPSMLDLLAATLGFVEREMPALHGRHAPALTASSAPPGFAASDAEPPSLRRRSISTSKMRAFRPPPSFHADRRGDSIPPPPGERTEELAEQALETNALASAVELAEQAIAEQPTSAKIKGRMRLVQAIACRWLGRFADAERYAQVACRALPRGSARWFSALGNLIVVLASKGESEVFLAEPAEELIRAQAGKKSVVALGAQVAALGQSAISLVRAGHHALAERSFDVAQTLAAGLPYDDVAARVWLDLAEAEFALQDGEPLRFLNLTELAVESFTARGDLRNACLCRANLGNGYQQLGAFARAEHELRAAVMVAERMKLGFLVPARINLGFALARLGRLREAAATVDDAQRRCAEQSFGRFVPVCQIYLAEILRLGGELHDAELSAQQAIRTSTPLPAVHAVALATLAGILLEQGRSGEALERSGEAMAILDALPSVEEGEALIRVTHVRALVAGGHLAKARGHLEQARRRLSLRAALIGDPRWLKTFLEEIPENRATREMRVLEAQTP